MYCNNIMGSLLQQLATINLYTVPIQLSHPWFNPLNSVHYIITTYKCTGKFVCGVK